MIKVLFSDYKKTSFYVMSPNIYVAKTFRFTISNKKEKQRKITALKRTVRLYQQLFNFTQTVKNVADLTKKGNN